jgi:large subunit ribosomal protein L31
MKPNLHPEYKDVKVTCSCGSVFVTRSTLGKDSLSLEVCSMCHPFYTGTQKIVDTAGRVDRFRQKYSRKGTAKAGDPKSEDKKSEDKK